MRLAAYNKSSAVAEQGDRLAIIDICRKVGELLCPFQWGGELGSYLTQCRLGRGLPPYQQVPSGMFIYPTFWPQYTNVTDRQDIGPVACGEPLLVTVAQKLQVSVVADETARRATSRQIYIRAANKGGRSV